MIYDSRHKVSSRIIVFQQKTQWQERNRLLTMLILSNIKQRYEKEKRRNQTLSAYTSGSSSCPSSLHLSCMFSLFWNYYEKKRKSESFFSSEIRLRISRSICNFTFLLKVLRLTDPSKLLKKLKLHEETDAGAKAPSTSNDLL